MQPDDPTPESVLHFFDTKKKPKHSPHLHCATFHVKNSRFLTHTCLNNRLMS